MQWFERAASVTRQYRLDRVHLVHAPLQSYGDYVWYAAPLQCMPRFHLVICDGPTEATLGGRYGLLPVMAPCLAADAVVLVDDADTATGRRVLARGVDEGLARTPATAPAPRARAATWRSAPATWEHEMIFADGRAFAFHVACATIWHALKGASADGEWRVTCSCKERIGFAATFAAAEALGREHGAARRDSTKKGRHVITLDQDGPR